jgi:cytochrome c-type biogenesis protein CcmH
MKAALRLLLVALLLGAAIPAAMTAAWAVQPDEMLQDPALEARARDISREIRCLVCQNQSIDDSDAELARDLRIIIRERLVAGDSDDAVRQYLVDRYGDFVLLKPPVMPATWLLWFGPPLLLVVALVGVGLGLRRRRVAAPAPLTAAERERLASLLAEPGDPAQRRKRR